MPVTPDKPQPIQPVWQPPTAEQEALQDPDITPWDLVPSPMSLMRGASKKVAGFVGRDIARETANAIKKVSKQATPIIKSEFQIAARTAMARGKEISKPTRYLNKNNMFFAQGGMPARVLHHGSGRASANTAFMKKNKFVGSVDEYDINFKPDRSILGKQDYDSVVSNYVLNVLPPTERASAIADIGSSIKPGGMGRAFITVRGKGSGIKGKKVYDGFRTSRGSFQKPYTPQSFADELKQHFDDVTILKGSDKSDMITAVVKNYKGGK